MARRPPKRHKYDEYTFFKKKIPGITMKATTKEHFLNQIIILQNGKKMCISISRIFSLGKTPSLHRHDLLGLHSKQSDRLTISMNAMHKIPTKMLPKKFAMTSKVSLIRKK